MSKNKLSQKAEKNKHNISIKSKYSMRYDISK